MSLSVDKMLSTVKIQGVDFDPNSTSEVAATLVAGAYLDMRDFGGLAVQFFRTVGVSDLTLKIVCSDAAATGGHEATVVTKVFTAGQPNAVGDCVYVECLAEQIAQLAATNGYNYRYAVAVLSFVTGTDEGVVNYIQYAPKFAFSGLTADYIS